MDSRECLHCKKLFYRRISNGYPYTKTLWNRRKFCSLACYGKYYSGKNSPCYKGGYYINTQGYKSFFLPGDKRILEHRLIVEKNLGRKLGKTEIVHHKDGNRLNNDINNLELTNLSKHTENHMRKWGGRHYNLSWLEKQLETMTQREIAIECKISEAAIGKFIDRHLRHPECKTWTEYYKTKKNRRELNRMKEER